MLKINECFYHLQGEDLFVKKKHIQNEIELIQVINGDGIILKNNHTYPLKSQYIYVIDARNTHLVNPEPDNCENYIRNKIVIDADSFINYFELIGAREIIETLFDSPPVPTLKHPEIDNIYKTIFNLFNSEKKEDIAFAHGYITELIHWVHINSDNKKTDMHKSTIQKMLDIINEKDGVTSLDEISKILYMDKFYLCHLFKDKTGTTLSGYLSDKIYEKSRKLLLDTTYSIERISNLCGFSSSASFTRFFKNKTGTTPSSYRKDKDAIL